MRWSAPECDGPFAEVRWSIRHVMSSLKPTCVYLLTETDFPNILSYELAFTIVFVYSHFKVAYKRNIVLFDILHVDLTHFPFLRCSFHEFFVLCNFIILLFFSGTVCTYAPSYVKKKSFVDFETNPLKKNNFPLYANPLCIS